MLAVSKHSLSYFGYPLSDGILPRVHLYDPHGTYYFIHSFNTFVNEMRSFTPKNITELVVNFTANLHQISHPLTLQLIYRMRVNKHFNASDLLVNRHYCLFNIRGHLNNAINDIA